MRSVSSARRVAPFTGAWIETLRSRKSCAAWNGRAFHGRVDRNGRRNHRRGAVRRVAPFTGAWIETSTHSETLPQPCASRLSRARGSKQNGVVVGLKIIKSRLSRARGSKHSGRFMAVDPSECRAFHGRVDRNLRLPAPRTAIRESRPSQARGSKPSSRPVDRRRQWGRASLARECAR